MSAAVGRRGSLAPKPATEPRVRDKRTQRIVVIAMALLLALPLLAGAIAAVSGG